MMTIYCNNHDRFMDTIAGLVRQGLTFKADADTLEIHLLGGY